MKPQRKTSSHPSNAAGKGNRKANNGQTRNSKEPEAGSGLERKDDRNGKNHDQNNVSNILPTQGGFRFEILANNMEDDLIDQDTQIGDDEEVIPKNQDHEMESESQPIETNDIMVEDLAIDIMPNIIPDLNQDNIRGKIYPR